MWNFTLDYTTTHFNVLGQTSDPEVLSRPSTHTPANAQFNDAVMVVVSVKLGRKRTLLTESCTRDLWCANPFAICSATPASYEVVEW